MEAKGNGSRQNWEREEENGGRKKKKRERFGFRSLNQDEAEHLRVL